MLQTPVIVVTGVDPHAMESTLLGLSWDLPRTVAVRHEIDPEREVLTRTVSDLSGVLEREEITLEHACISCALREDIIPTIARVAADGRWESVVACLPAGAEPAQLGAVIARDTRLQRTLRVAAFIAALSGEDLVDDLLGDVLLAERGLHAGPRDRRGVGEVGCGLTEYADLTVITDRPDDTAVDLVGALVRPGTPIVVGPENLDAIALLAGRHDHATTRQWVSSVFTAPVPVYESGRVWRLELASSRPFHPSRLLAGIERLGTGRHRSRGSFWLPSRPGQFQAWDGSGGQLSVGPGELTGRRPARTRLLLTGTGLAPAHLREAFESLLLGAEESYAATAADGFEPWLGTIREAA